MSGSNGAVLLSLVGVEDSALVGKRRCRVTLVADCSLVRKLRCCVVEAVAWFFQSGSTGYNGVGVKDSSLVRTVGLRSGLTGEDR